MEFTTTKEHAMTYYFAGAPYLPATCIPSNVTGNCPHKHRTPGAAQRCIDDLDRSIKRGHGSAAYCDRVVMVADEDNIDHPMSVFTGW